MVLPTRELAQQVAEHFRGLASATKLRCVVVHGGVEIGRQDQALNDGAELCIATPGRLLDHLERGGLKFSDLQYFVVDEADRLFDKGFLPDLRRLVDQLPDRRQTLLFSATMPKEMERFAHSILREPERIEIGMVGPRETIREEFYPVPEHQKFDLLSRVLSEEKHLERVLVFVRTRAKAHDFMPRLARQTGLKAAELHSDLAQEERDRTVRAFREGEVQLLVATDVASRGLDIAGLSHVINFDVPNTPDDYIHRVGRTGRVDRTGVAITLVAPNELALATAIEADLRRRIPMTRIPGFGYDAEEETEQIQPMGKRGKAGSLQKRVYTKGKKESPFTKSGELKPEHRKKEFDKPPRRGEKKRLERRILSKKLPHQRKKR